MVRKRRKKKTLPSPPFSSFLPCAQGFLHKLTWLDALGERERKREEDAERRRKRERESGGGGRRGDEKRRRKKRLPLKKARQREREMFFLSLLPHLILERIAASGKFAAVANA